MKHKILVTGSAGFIGYHTVAKLIKKNYNVVGIDNLNSYYDKKLKISRHKELKKISKSSKKYQFYKLNICNKNQLKKIFKLHKFKIVLHFAAQAGIRFSLKKPQQYINSNLLGFFNILDLCKEFKVAHFVYASSSSVYGSSKNFPYKEKNLADHPLQLYAATKRSNELMAHSYSSLYNLPTTGIRFFTVYGPFGRPDMALYKFTKNIIFNKKIEIYNNGKHFRDFTYIDDVTEGILKTIKKKPLKNKIKQNKIIANPSESNAPFRIINIGNGKSISLISCINLIEKILEKKAHKKFMPAQKGDAFKTHSDLSKTKKILNYKPRVNFQKGLTNFIEWFKTYYKIK